MVDRAQPKGEAVSTQINSKVPGRPEGAPEANSELRVQLGHVVATRAVDRRLLCDTDGRAFVMACLRRHERCDWGDVVAEDAEANDTAMITGARILSSYLIPRSSRRGSAGDGEAEGDELTGPGVALLGGGGDERLWIITEATDGRGVRSQTTVLFPSDY